ncbi:phage baseplate protein [Nicoliella lavandulae]|uniref:Dit-like phage tail protein N-terminal domain-containing protein n=1 Tax=Nicoliella lavandulae TaxID=3082954 RepID=A0ABU8SNM6_9LACO
MARKKDAETVKYERELRAQRIKQADIRTKEEATKSAANASKLAAEKKAAWNKAAASNKSKSSSNSSSKKDDKQASAGSDVKTVTKIMNGHVVNLVVNNKSSKKETAAEEKANAKERTKMRSLDKRIKGDSTKSLTKHADSLSDKVKNTAHKIGKAEEAIRNNQKIQDSYQDYLNAKGGAAGSANENIKAIDSKIADITKQIAKSKRKSEKESLQKRIDSLNNDRKKDVDTIAKFNNGSEYQSWLAKNKRATASIKQMKKSISAMKIRKSRYKDELSHYKKEINRQKDAKQKHLEKKNKGNIEKKIKDDTDSITKRKQKLTYIYRDDCKSDTLIKLLETSPSEQNQVNAPQKSIDSGLPLEHFIQNSGLTLSGQYAIYEPTYAKRVSVYNTLRKWQNDGVAIHIRGFTHWDHVLISSLSRSTAAESNGNALILNIEMQHARVAKIQYAKQAQGKKHKAKGSKKAGTSKTKHRSVKIKPGMTYSQVSAKMGIKVSELRKLNPKYKDMSLPVGGKMEVS